jgi:aspartate/methionine/tyrosine aminotransferase
VLREALSPLGEDAIAGGEGAIYFFVRLPPGCDDDVAVNEWLVREAGVCTVPGSSCGAPGAPRCWAVMLLEV